MNFDLLQIKIFAINFVNVLGSLISYAVLVRIILSWMNFGGNRKTGKFTFFIQDITEPILKIARKLPHRIGLLDLSPFTAMIMINIITYLLIKMLNYL